MDEQYQPQQPTTLEPEFQPSPRRHISSEFIILVLGVLLLAGVAYGGIWIITRCYDGWFTISRCGIKNIDDTANWQTYRNEEYGFEFKYPATWELESKVIDSVKSVDDGFNRAAAYLTIYPPDYSNYQYVKKIELGLTKTSIKTTADVLKENQNFNSTKNLGDYLWAVGSTPENTPGAGAPTYSLIRGGVRIGISAWEFQQDRNVVERILSTFRFIPSTPLGTSEPEICIQVITPARNLETGETRDFPTPCDVPEGWDKITEPNSKDRFFFLGFRDSGIHSVNYDGSGLSKVLSDPISAFKLSPDFKKIAYTKYDQVENEMQVKLFDVAQSKSSTLARYPKDKIGPLITELKWSRDSKMLTWHLTDFRDEDIREVHYITYLKDGEVVKYVLNPYTGYIEFQRIDGYGLSPNGNYVYIMGDIENTKGERTRALILYNIVKEDTAMYYDRDDLILHEIFFDGNSDLYFAIPGLWLKYGLTTGTTETFKKKPAQWDKLKYSVYNLNGEKATYYCTTAMKSLCLSDPSDFSKEKKITPVGEVRGIQEYLWSPDGKYIFYYIALDEDPFWWYTYSLDQDKFIKLVEGK